MNPMFNTMAVEPMREQLEFINKKCTIALAQHNAWIRESANAGEEVLDKTL
jgi:hypothetical protein